MRATGQSFWQGQDKLAVLPQDQSLGGRSTPPGIHKVSRLILPLRIVFFTHRVGTLLLVLQCCVKNSGTPEKVPSTEVVNDGCCHCVLVACQIQLEKKRGAVPPSGNNIFSSRVRISAAWSVSK